MGYRTNNSLKHERKRGMDAMREMVAAPGFDPQATLALAQKHADAFGKLDDLDNITFVKRMDDMRKNLPHVYPVFWWWRDAQEQAGRRQETDSDKPESRYRSFMIVQFLREPFSDDWEDDRVTLKPGIEPWITEDQIAQGLDHKTIKQWAWIWHDRDFYTESDESADETGRIKAGERKFKHAHVMIDVPAKVPVSTVARWFNVPPSQVEIYRGRGAFLDGVEYLVHESPRAVAEHKTHYEDDDMHACPGFDFRKEITDLQVHRAKFGKRAGEMTPADTMRMHMMQDGWNMKQCRDDDPLTYAKIRNTLPPLRLDYLLDSPPCPFRLNIYVDGPGGTGKSSFCRYIAQTMFKNTDSPYFRIGNDARVTFDGYDGQPAIIWDDMRAVSLIKQFGREGVFRLFDPHPDQDAQQAKHSRIILCNMLNIINGVEPYDEFIAGLAGTYTDKDGKRHEAENENQAWRRFPLILRVRMEDFTVLFNKGFVDDDLSSIQTMQQYAQIRGSMKVAMEKLAGVAKDQALLTFGKPVEDAVKMITDSHDANKISDPALVPPGMMPVIEYQAASFAKAEVDAKARKAKERYGDMIAEAAALGHARMDTLVEFACWFWTATLGGFGGYMEKHPEEWGKAECEIAFAQDDAKLKKAIKDCRPYFEGPGIEEYMDTIPYWICQLLPLIKTFSDDELLEAVKAAWNGCFGDLPPLTKDPNYRPWVARNFGTTPEAGYKICYSCHKSFPADANFCHCCGKKLPDNLYFEDLDFSLARIRLARLRNCEMMDVPDEDVKAEVYHAESYEGD